MKKLIFILLLLPTLIFGQTGAGYTPSGEGKINYKSYKTHSGNGAASSYNGVSYSGGAGSTAEFDAMVDTNQPGTTLTHVGEATPWSSGGLNGGHPPRWGNSYFAIVYSGWFKPNKNGTYNFKTYADDSSETRYREVGTTTWQTITFQWGCCSNRYGTANLDNTKWYEFEFRYQEYGGGDYYYFGYSIPANSSSPNYNWISSNHQFGTWTNVDPGGGTTTTEPEVDLDLEFHSQLSPEQYRFGVYYDASNEQDGSTYFNTSTMNSKYYLDDDGSKDITDYLNLVKMTDGLKATTESGSVEWVVLYPYDSTNDRHRILIDGREFTATNPDTDPNDLKSLQLLDLYDGTITVHSVSEGSDGWQQYYIPGNLTTAISNSSYGSGVIRNAGSYFGIRAEFSFEDVEIYKGHKIVVNNPSDNIEGWTAEEFMDDYITVADVVAGFNELAGGGIFGGYKGDLSGVQLQNSDVNQDGEFDFQDSQIGLAFLNGDDTPFNGYLQEIMRIVPKSEYDNTTTSNWKTQANKSPSTNFTFSIIDTIQTLEYKVSFIGDVNLSHSAPQSTSSPGTQSMSIRNSSSQKSNEFEVLLDISKEEDKFVVTLDVPQNNHNIVGSEFRIGYDNTRVEFDRIETTSNLQSFSAERTNYIKLGSISTDGSQNLNGGVQYKIYFSPQQTFESILGLLSVTKSELVKQNGGGIDHKIK
jgi:hypothetical protein